MQGAVEGRRKRGRQRKRWEDDIREWKDMVLSEPFLTRTENQEGWRKQVDRYVCICETGPYRKPVYWH